VENINKAIATALRSLRKEKGWSLDTASLNTAVSKAMLGQIERGESSPTIATLWKIAAGFNVSLSYFVSHDNKQSTQYAAHPKQIKLQDDKILIMPLFPYDQRLGFEVFIVELLPNYEHISEAHQFGLIEHIIVSQGSIDVLANDVWSTLKENEGLSLNADQPHGYRNITDQKAVFYNLIHYKI